MKSQRALSRDAKSIVHRPAVHGFTLVELLVVIAIIGVLVALLLPAVQAAREAARRTTCTNQLKQMGLAIQNHVSAHQVFPTGGIHPWPQIEDYSASGKPFGPGKQGLSWAFQILPYLEQNAVHNLSTARQLLTTPIDMYFCPSRRPPTRNFEGFWLIDYAALTPVQSRGQMGNDAFDALLADGSGCRDGWGFWGVKDWSNLWGNEMKTADELGDNYQGFWGVIVRSSYRVKPGSRGAVTADSPKDMGYTPPVRFAQIEDGSSNTALIGEKRLVPERYATGDWHDEPGWSDGWDADTLRSSLCQPQADGPMLRSEEENGLTAGSAHPAGLQVIFADGSVHLIRYEVDLETFNRLAHRADGEIINPQEL